MNQPKIQAKFLVVHYWRRVQKKIKRISNSSSTNPRFKPNECCCQLLDTGAKEDQTRMSSSSCGRGRGRGSSSSGSSCHIKIRLLGSPQPLPSLGFTNVEKPQN